MEVVLGVAPVLFERVGVGVGAGVGAVEHWGWGSSEV